MKTIKLLLITVSIVVFAICLAMAEEPAEARELIKGAVNVQTSDVPDNFLPFLTIEANGIGRGIIFAELDNSSYDPQLQRILILFAFTKNPQNVHSYKVLDLFSVEDLRNKPFVLKFKGYEAVKISSNNLDRYGGDLSITLLKDATNVMRDKTKTRRITLTIENGRPVAQVKGEYFDVLRLVPNTAPLVGIVGIEKIIFENYMGPIYTSKL